MDLSRNRWSATINGLPHDSAACVSANEDSPSPGPPGLGRTSCDSHKWFREQLWTSLGVTEPTLPVQYMYMTEHLMMTEVMYIVMFTKKTYLVGPDKLYCDAWTALF